MVGGIHALAALVPDSSDCRSHKRVDLKFRVRVKRLAAQDEAVEEQERRRQRDLQAGFTENVSHSGLGLRWEQAAGAQVLAQGDRVVAEILVPKVNRRVRCLGRVAWTQAEGGRYFRAGVAFEGINLEDLAGVQATLATPPRVSVGAGSEVLVHV